MQTLIEKMNFIVEVTGCPLTLRKGRDNGLIVEHDNLDGGYTAYTNTSDLEEALDGMIDNFVYGLEEDLESVEHEIAEAQKMKEELLMKIAAAQKIIQNR